MSTDPEPLPRTDRREVAFDVSVYSNGDTAMAYVPRDAAIQPGFPLDPDTSTTAVAIAETCVVLFPTHRLPQFPAAIQIDDPDPLTSLE